MAKDRFIAGLRGLNDKQLQAVKTTKGPLLINAVAGSGKTRVVTFRIAYLIKIMHVRPWNILAITFTNKAASEMRDRVNALLGTKRSGVWVSTFHALGISILRRFARYIHYKPTFTIMGDSTQKTLVKHIMKGVLNIDIKQYAPRDVLGAISNAKNNLITPDEYHNWSAVNMHSPFQKVVNRVYGTYQAELLKENSMDFDDLIMKPVLLFEKVPKVLHFYQSRFLYIHVDEYQDTNEAQYRMVNLLAQKNKNLCVVGDADQSIYGWRGANIHNIMNFSRDYPNAHVVLMNENYRSTKNILRVANSVIKHNKHRPKDKSLWTSNQEGPKVGYYQAGDYKEEANFVVGKIQENHLLNNFQYNDFAVLYRTNAQSRVIEKALMMHDIPYQVIGGLKFYDRKEIQDTLAYLNLIVNHTDDTAFDRIVNVPKRKIGQTSVNKLSVFASENNYSMLQAAEHVDDCTTLGPSPSKKIKHFADIIEELGDKVHKEKLTEATEDMWEDTGYLGKLRKKSKHNMTARNRIENLEEFTSVTKQYDIKHHKYPLSIRMNKFLSDIALISAQDEEDENKPAVTLMTIHASKGLEFPVVFIIGMEESIFPLSHADEGIENLPEERRLCYVAITRAEKKLYLSRAVYRMMYGKPQTNPESRFIHEIKPGLLRPVKIQSSDEIAEEKQKKAQHFFNQNPPSDKPF